MANMLIRRYFGISGLLADGIEGWGGRRGSRRSSLFDQFATRSDSHTCHRSNDAPNRGGSSEYVRIAGTVTPATRRRSPPTLQLTSTLTATSRDQVDSGTYESIGCPEGQYAWERWRVQQVFTCTPSTSLASLPIRYRWQILTVGGGPPELLRGPASVIERQAECFLPDTIPARREVRTCEYRLRDLRFGSDNPA